VFALRGCYPWGTMRELTRRDFLKLAGMAAAGASLGAAGCGSQTVAEPPAGGRLASPQPSASGKGGRSLLAVARGPDAADITAAAVAALGGMERFVAQGADVIVKPNICTGYHGPEYAATTNPDVVATLVSLCRRAGAGRVRVMDLPFGGPAEEAYRVSGIQAAVEKAGGQMQVMAPAGFRDYRIPDGRDLRSWPIYGDVLSCDVLIDVPIAKDHGTTRLSLAGKIHANIGQRTADLVSVIRPTLTVVDAVRILTANGPTGGDLNDVERLDTVLASSDIVAADSYAATLFDLTATDVPYVPAEHAMGLGEMDLDKVEIRKVRV
jgi:uncharacterized protein (DUF362 family)